MRRIGDRTDLVEHWRRPLGIKPLDRVEIAARRRGEEAEAERLRAGRFDAVEHRVRAADVNPPCADVRGHGGARLDEPRVAVALGPFQTA